MLRHFISRAFLCALVLLPAGKVLAQPDPATFGSSLESGDIAQLRRWLDTGLPADFMADRIGTGLMIGAWRGDIPMMELLLARGADVNKTNALGESALMHAAWRGHADAVKWLASKGARIDSDPMRWGPLHYAAFAGHDKVAILLLDLGANIDARSTNGSSPLMMAVYEGHEQLVRRLLARGADRSVKNDRGEGAIDWAFKFQRHAIASLVAAPEEFVARANLPRSHWAEPVRSQPTDATAMASPQGPVDDAAQKIEDLVKMRNTLAARKMTDAVNKLDKRIAGLRAQRARAERNTPAAVLEISASRASPGEQRARLLFGADGPPP